MTDTTELSLAELLKGSQFHTRRANLAESRRGAWLNVMRDMKKLIEEYEGDNTMIAKLDPIRVALKNVEDGRIEKLDQIARESRAEAARLLEVYEMRD